MIKKNTHIHLVMLLFTACMAFSCGKESSCFKGSGNTITEGRNINNDIIKVILEDNIDLVIIQDSTASLNIEGGENLLPFINSEVNGNELKLSSDNKCGFFRDYNKPLTVYLRIPNLTQIEYTGQGNISSLGQLVFPNFEFDTRKGTGSVNLNMSSNNLFIRQHTGPSDITVSGITDKAYYYTGGNGWMYFDQLKATDVHVNNAGSGDIILQATNSLLVELRSLGNIEYYGNPSITVSVHSGKGVLTKR